MTKRAKQVIFFGISLIRRAYQTWFLPAICITLILGYSISCANVKGKWIISADNPPVIEITVPVSTPMEFAASELARYLGQILGIPNSVKLVDSVKPEDSGKPRIVIEKVADNSPMGDESFDIFVEGKTLRIRGGGDLGVVYGVYEFLHRYGGCRFSGLGPDGELVPERRNIIVDGLPVRMKPKLWYRGPQFSSRGAENLSEEESTQLCVQWIDWMAKNRFNYIMYNPYRFTGDWFDRNIRPEMIKRGLKFDMNHHNFKYWLPAEVYYETHPEWFPMVDGKRLRNGNQLAICSSNPAAVQTVLDNIKKYLRSYPEVSIIGVIPEDGFGMCHCKECTRMDVENGIDPNEQYRDVNKDPLKGPSNLAKTRRYTLLVNQVARGIHEEFPNVLVGMAAYVDLTWPDKKIPLESNVVVWVATYWADGCCPIAEDSPTEKNRMFYDALKQWRSSHPHPGKVITYSYYMGMAAQRSLPYPQDRVILQEWKNLKALGIDGATMQNWPSNQEVYGLNLIAISRSGWQDDVNPDTMLNEYLKGMYGSVAKEIQPIFNSFHESWLRAEEKDSVIMPNGESIVLLIDDLGLDKIDECLRSARQKAKNDRERRQAANLTLAASYWKMAAEFYKLLQQVGIAELAQDKNKARALKEQAVLLNQQIQKIIEKLPGGWVMPKLAPRWERMRQRLLSSTEGTAN